MQPEWNVEILPRPHATLPAAAMVEESDQAGRHLPLLGGGR